jgi:hypothetical protein
VKRVFESVKRVYGSAEVILSGVCGLPVWHEADESSAALVVLMIKIL